MVQTRVAPPPTKRHRDDGYGDPASSGSELSSVEDDEDLEEEEEVVEDDELESESESDPDAEGDVDSYVDEDEKEPSDEENLIKPRIKLSSKGSSNRARSSAAKPSTSRKPARSSTTTAKRTVGERTRAAVVAPPPPSRMVTRARTRGTSSSFATTQAYRAPFGKPPTSIKLKIGKEKLRDATATWTPEPGEAADSGDQGGVSTPSEATPAPMPRVRIGGSAANGMRGRRVVEDDSDEDEEMADEDEDEDAEGEDDEELIEEDAEGETDDEMGDSDGDTGTEFLSRTATPDLTRLTSRQRSKLGQVTSGELAELPPGLGGPRVPEGKTLTVQEQELRRAETARRRKTFADQKLQEEKMDTINRLLKKQTPKMRKGRATGEATPAAREEDIALGLASPPPPPSMLRWISDAKGIRLGVPQTWLNVPAGRLYEPQVPTERMVKRRKMVEEVA